MVYLNTDIFPCRGKHLQLGGNSLVDPESSGQANHLWDSECWVWLIQGTQLLISYLPCGQFVWQWKYDLKWKILPQVVYFTAGWGRDNSCKILSWGHLCLATFCFMKFLPYILAWQLSAFMIGLWEVGGWWMPSGGFQILQETWALWGPFKGPSYRPNFFLPSE